MKLGASEMFNSTQIAGLNKLGDLMVPANADFPAFSETGCTDKLDKVMSPAHKDDIMAFGILLWVFNYLPRFAIRFLLNILDQTEKMPKLVAGPFRLLNLSLRGVVYSLYYSNHTSTHFQGDKVYDVIDFDVTCTPLSRSN